ncbi:uncharacterized protein LOC143861501 [Tasmannia lanceolata]|uniref:uncharacterized protein LOC143861501 n=1 Tax=Tasmannia lanceolata TaxID=3420 RepID=UPI0040631EE4
MGGTSSVARKAYARQINAVHTSHKKLKVENEISFSDANLDNLILPHDDALVITMVIANWELKKIMVDNGSSVDILYYRGFKQMMIGDERLKPANSDLFGFSGEIVKVEGQIELPVLVGVPPHQAFVMVNFLVVRATSAYNAILGRPGQNLLRAIASAYHQKMKFITPNGVGEVKWDQPQSRECYVTALRKNASEALPIELQDLRDETRTTINQPAKDLVPVPLYEDDQEKLVKIGSTLNSDSREELVRFLQKMLTPVKRKRRHFNPERQQAVREEVEKLLRADFIQEIKYPDWLANEVMNAGATYQRLVNKIFKEQIGRNMELYVDDMLVKSKESSGHISDLEETFQVLRKHNMKLNPSKCTFCVAAGKFLGFMVSQRGIEANSEKNQAVVDLNPPTTIREIQKLTAMVATLGRFISKSAERCLPFFSAIKGIKTAPWTPEC